MLAALDFVLLSIAVVASTLLLRPGKKSHSDIPVGTPSVLAP